MRAFKQVDVFTSVPLLGNPVAVVLDAEGLDQPRMQAIARWTNLSETTFVSAPTLEGADYAVRIFTPASELPFAGHPTLGTAHALLDAGRVTPKGGRLRQQCPAGLVELGVAPDWRRDGVSLRLPRYARVACPGAEEGLLSLGPAAVPVAPPVAVDCGPVWLVAELGSAAAVDRLRPDYAALHAFSDRVGITGVTVFAREGDGIVVRSFAPAAAMTEDPVCGSGNGAVAAYRLWEGAVSDGSVYAASQGRQVGRDGHVRVRIEGEAIHIGGTCVTCVDGTMAI